MLLNINPVISYFKSCKSLGERWNEVRGKPSGFDYIRIILATTVLLWHSIPSSYGVQFALDLWRGPLGAVLIIILPMFFALSGFLVTSSFERNPQLKTFLTLRAIRIYPALSVEVFLSAFILGPIVTTMPLKEYFSDQLFWEYMANFIGWVHYYLPGVFLDNPSAGIVNGSLWTVPFELECYILFSIVVLANFMKSYRRSAVLFVAATIIVYFWLRLAGQSGAPAGGVNGRVLMLCFLGGALIFRIRRYLPFSFPLAIAALILGILLFRLIHTAVIAPFFIAYATAYLGLLNPRRSVVVNSGDYSYGTYLYAGPIQQSVVWLLGPLNNWFSNVALALPLTICFALFSWHMIEKPFLKVKRWVLREA